MPYQIQTFLVQFWNVLEKKWMPFCPKPFKIWTSQTSSSWMFNVLLSKITLYRPIVIKRNEQPEPQWTTGTAMNNRKRNRLQKTLYLECKSLKVDATLTVKSFHLRLYFWVVPIFTLVKTSRICWASQGETRPRAVVYNLCHVCFDFPVWAIKTFLLESLHQTVFENWKK